MLLAGCAAAGGLLAGRKMSAPPEFNQKVLLEVSDQYQMYQAPRSTYDVADLQSFQSQQTFPVLIEAAFREIFGQVELIHPKQKTDALPEDVPAVFEVRILDLDYDLYNGGDTYRSEVTIAVYMKSPDLEHLFWQKSFRGSGLVHTGTAQFSDGRGPQDALVDAMRDAVDQMQKALLAAPEVRMQMKDYLESQAPPQAAPAKA